MSIHYRTCMEFKKYYLLSVIYLPILRVLVLIVPLFLHVGVSLVLRPPLRGRVPLLRLPRPYQRLGEHRHSDHALRERGAELATQLPPRRSVRAGGGGDQPGRALRAPPAQYIFTRWEHFNRQYSSTGLPTAKLQLSSVHRKQNTWNRKINILTGYRAQSFPGHSSTHRINQHCTTVYQNSRVCKFLIICLPRSSMHYQ